MELNKQIALGELMIAATLAEQFTQYVEKVKPVIDTLSEDMANNKSIDWQAMCKILVVALGNSCQKCNESADAIKKDPVWNTAVVISPVETSMAKDTTVH